VHRGEIVQSKKIKLRKIMKHVDVRSYADQSVDLGSYSKMVMQYQIVDVEEVDGIGQVQTIKHEGHFSLSALSSALRSKIALCQDWKSVDQVVRAGVAQSVGSTNIPFKDLTQLGVLKGTTYVALFLASDIYVTVKDSASFSKDSF
jgi:hypothetical protein